MTYAITDLLPLPNSTVQIPRLGFGVYRCDPNQCEKSILTALRSGYRHIDTAQFYKNEDEVGTALRNCGLDRNDVFVTTKIMAPAGSAEATYQKVLDSVKAIAGEGDGAYVDLFLIHSASCGKEGRRELWGALERLMAEGKTRGIGVSNFGVGHIEEMKAYAKVWPPQVNQLEVCSFFFFFSFLLLLDAINFWKTEGSNFGIGNSCIRGVSRRLLMRIVNRTASSWRHIVRL